MGKLIHEAIRECGDMELMLVVDRSNEQELYRLKQPADLMIDFSHPDAFDMVLRYVKYSGCALLSGTTGLSEYQIMRMHQLRYDTRIMYASNYSLGIALMLAIVRWVTPYVREDFDLEIIEAHHAKKQDAPSGTAIRLMQAMQKEESDIQGCKYNPDQKGDIGIHVIRGGSLPGEHTVLYLGDQETLQITHTAYSRKLFVNGAMKAARWLMKQESGCYRIEDMMGGYIHGNTGDD